MAIVPEQELYDYLGEDDSADATEVIESLRDAAEAWIQTYCDRKFESASYAEWYDSFHDGMVVLRQYPVTAVSGISNALTEAICIKNTTAVLNATVTCSTTALSLVKDGGTASSLAFSTYTTLQLLVNAVNALADGWEASLVESTYASISPTFLQAKTSGYCMNQNTSLYVPDFSSTPDVDLDSDWGVIYRQGGFVEGENSAVFSDRERSIFVTYTAGYSAAAMPNDLKLAVKILTKYLLQRRDEEGFGARSQSVGGISFTNEGDLPWEVKHILDAKYKKRHV